MKNKLRIFAVALFTCTFILGNNVYAFTISNYYDNQNISIGLKSMERSQLKITLNGAFLSLPSAMYDLSYDATSDTYSFDGEGNGHGIGMSQIGAKNRAAAGQSFEDILKFYYDGKAQVLLWLQEVILQMH